MDNIKNDRYYLDKILADLEHIMRITDGKTSRKSKETKYLPIRLCSVLFKLPKTAKS